MKTWAFHIVQGWEQEREGLNLCQVLMKLPFSQLNYILPPHLEWGSGRVPNQPCAQCGTAQKCLLSKPTPGCFLRIYRCVNSPPLWVRNAAWVNCSEGMSLPRAGSFALLLLLYCGVQASRHVYREMAVRFWRETATEISCSGSGGLILVMLLRGALRVGKDWHVCICAT